MAKPGYRLALFATALALLVVLLGAYTRLTHAGLGCPDWPGCYGFIGVPQSAEQLAHAEQHYPQAPVEAHKGWNEMVHRYFAGSLGLLILVLAIQALRRRREPGQPLKLPLLLLALVTAAERGMPIANSLRFVAVGGGRVSAQLLERADALGLPDHDPPRRQRGGRPMAEAAGGAGAAPEPGPEATARPATRWRGTARIRWSFRGRSTGR